MVFTQEMKDELLHVLLQHQERLSETLPAIPDRCIIIVQHRLEIVDSLVDFAKSLAVQEPTE